MSSGESRGHEGRALPLGQTFFPFRGITDTLFWTSGNACPGFQSKSGFPARFLTCVIVSFTSGVTPVDCTEVSMAAKPF